MYSAMPSESLRVAAASNLVSALDIVFILQLYCPSNIPLLARLATTTQQNDQLSSLQRIVQAIPWPVIDANFAEPTTDGLEVSNQAQLKALDSDGYTRDSTTVSQRLMNLTSKNRIVPICLATILKGACAS
jgi:hypothetical protein